MSGAILARKSENAPVPLTKAPVKPASSVLRISEPDDAFEREADRVANAVSAGNRIPDWSITKIGFGQVQRQAAPTVAGNQPAPPPNNYQDAAAKLAEAFLQTDVGKELAKAASEDPLAKAGSDFLSTLPGKIVAGAAATGAVAAMAATHTPLPAQIPEIPLDKIAPGLKVKITYEGPVDHPTKAMLTFSYTPEGGKKKSAQTESERYRAETARIAAEQEKFRAGLKYPPGSPQDLQQKADQKMTEDWALHRFGTLPGFGDRPLVPGGPAPGAKETPAGGLQLPSFESPFKPKSHSLLDQKLELKPMTPASAAPQADTDAKKREEISVQRKAESGAAVVADPLPVNEVLHSSGRPLDRETRSLMQSKIGFDFAKVRVHTDARAAASAKALGARAYTVGNDLVFAEGQYQPRNHGGQHLIAHELTHVVQAGSERASHPTIRRQAAMPDVYPTSPPPPPGIMSPTADGQPDSDEQSQLVKPDADSDKVKADGSPEVDPTAVNRQGAGDAGTDAGQAKAETRAKSVEKAAQNAEGKNKDKAAPEAENAVEADPKSVAGMPTSALALIDEELAEHERWGAATAMVGGAGSKERAAFIAQTATAAAESGLKEGLTQGVKTGVGMKVAEKLVEKGAIKLATRVGAQAAKFTPLPAVGAVIGGVMSAYELASRDWKATGESIGRFGKGASVYDELANSIEAISTVIDVASQVLNVIAGVIGAISIAMWVITVLTVGVATPLAATLSTIAAGIGLATMVLDGINSLVLKQLITMFRELHAFTSEADPRDVVTQGNAIGEAAGAATGFLGGLGGGIAGGALGEKGVHVAEKGMHTATTKPSTPVPDHSMPPPAPGEGPSIKAEVPVPSETAGAKAAQPNVETKTLGAVAETKAAPAAPTAATAEVKASPTVETKPSAGATGAPAIQAPEIHATGEPKATAAPPETKAAQPSPKAEAAEAKPGPKTKEQPTSGAQGGGPPEKKLTAKQRKLLKELAEGKEATPAHLEALSAFHGGIPLEDAQVLLDRAHQAQEVLERRRMAKGGGGVDEEFHRQVDPEERPKAMERGEKMPGRWEATGETEEEALANKKRVLGSQRRRARKVAARLIRDTLRENRDDKLTRTTREYLGDEAMEYIRKKGKFPRGVEVHHFLTIADFPEFGHLGGETLPLPEDVHKQAAHAGDTTRPVEAATLLDPDAMKRKYGIAEGNKREPGVIAQSRESLIEIQDQIQEKTKNAKAADRRAQAADDQGRTGQAKIARREARQHRENVRNLEIQARKMAEAMPELKEMVASATKEQRKDLGRPARKAPVETTTAGPENGPAPEGTPNSATESAPESATQQQQAAPQPVADQPEVKIRVATEEAPAEGPKFRIGPHEEPKLRVEPPEEPRFRVEEEHRPGAAEETEAAEAEAEEEEAAPKPAEKKKKSFRMGMPPVGATKPDDKEPESGLMRNLREFSQMDTDEMTGTEKAVFLAGGPLAGTAGVNTMHGFEQARQEPIVEHVNPKYPAPPCTPQEIVNVKNEILQTLDARAKTEAVSQAAAGQVAHHKGNEKPLASMQKGTEDAISATESHKQAVARRTEANQQKTEKEKVVSGSLSDYSDRAARLATVTVPMRGFARFTSLANSLPDDPEVLVGAKRGILKMNSDSRKFLSQLDKMDNTINEQKTSQPDREKQIQADGSTLDQTDKKAGESDKTFGQAKQTNEDLDTQNKDRLGEATKVRSEANQTSAALDNQAQEKRTQAQSLTAALDAWSHDHRQVRLDALEQTKKSMEEQGYKVTEVKER